MKYLIAAFCMLLAPAAALAVSESDFNALFNSPPRSALAVPAAQAAAEALPVTPIATPQQTLPEPNASAAPEAERPATRNSFEISYEDVEKAVSAALVEKGVSEHVGAKVTGRKNAPVFAFHEPVTVAPRGLQFDQKTGRWSANLYFSLENGEIVTVLPAAGHFTEMLEVPVLKRQVRNGDVIRDSDIEMREFTLTQTRADTLTDAATLVGKTPVRTISPYRPVRNAEIANPAIIRKDAIVQMHYSIPGMQISTTGQALAAGAKGDVIDVRNTGSRKVVRAVIISADTVSVSATLETSQLDSKEGSHAY